MTRIGAACSGSGVAWNRPRSHQSRSVAKFIAIITRTLREGKTLQDYRDAWFHSRGFGVPTTMYTSVNIAN